MKQNLTIQCFSLRMLILFLFPLFFSCKTYRLIDIEVLLPADSLIIDDVSEIVVVDRQLIHEKDFEDASSIGEKWNLSRQKLLNNFIDGVYYGLLDGEKIIEAKKGRSVTIRNIGNDKTTIPLEIEHIRSLTNSGNFSHILSIEYASLRYGEKGDNEIECNLLLRVYRVTDGAVLYEVLTETLKIPYRTPLVKQTNKIREFFHEQGYSMIKMLTPVWQTSGRRIYTDSKILKSGYEYYEKEDFENARKTWERALIHNDDDAVKAIMNIAWLCEMDGNFESARVLLETAKNSIVIHNKKLRKYFNDYHQLIISRIKNEVKIEQHLN